MYKAVLDLNKIYCGNNIELIKEIPDNSIDMCITSPPYDNLRDYDKCTFTFKDFKKISVEIKRVLKPGRVLVWVVNDATIEGSETLTSFKQALYFKRIGFRVHDTMIYSKKGVTVPPDSKGTHKRYLPSFEYMFILVKDKITVFNPLTRKTNYTKRELGKDKYKSRRQQDGSIKKAGYSCANPQIMKSNIWEVDCGYMKSTTDDIAYDHPAIFPESLANDHILSWSNPNDIILDPFIGSGTTGKIALKLNRNFIGFEICKEYVKIANDRIFKNSFTLDSFANMEKVTNDA